MPFDDIIGGSGSCSVGPGELLSRNIAPTADWSEMHGSDHFVQFYRSDEYLTNSIAEYILHGFKRGDICIVVATASHRQQINQVLSLFGTELKKARDGGLYIEMDAEETLDTFMSNDIPDPDLFDKNIGEIVRSSLRPGRRVRIFGEMVSVLWNNGRREAAIDLEKLWEALSKDTAFSLFCAYPTSLFGDPTGASGIERICDKHTRVIPDETYTSLGNVEDRLREIVLLQQKAQQLTSAN